MRDCPVINSHRKTAENDFNHIGGFLLFFLVYVILEAFAGLESRRVARGDFDFFARLRVFAFSCFSFTRFKSSEADKLNLVVLLYGILYSVNKCLRSDRRIFKCGLIFLSIFLLFIVTPPRRIRLFCILSQIFFFGNTY